MAIKSSLLVPTYCGKEILELFFEGISNLEKEPENILFVVKPCPESDRDSLNTIEKYINKYDIYIIKYTDKYGLIKQILLGLKVLYKLGYDIAIFLDDDSYIISKNFVEKHKKWYQNKIIGAVEGYGINAIRIGKNFKLTFEKPIKPKPFYLWRRPSLTYKGIPYIIYFTRGGYVTHWGNDTYYVTKKTKFIFTLPGGGSNMSIRISPIIEAINEKNVLPNVTVGYQYEKVLSYIIAKKGYLTIKDYSIQSYHIYRPTGETRMPKKSRISIKNAVNEIISYHMLYLYRNDFSVLYKIINILQRLYLYGILDIMNTNDNEKIKLFISHISGIFYGNIIGIYYILAKNKDHIYSKLKFFEKFMQKIVD